MKKYILVLLLSFINYVDAIELAGLSLESNAYKQFNFDESDLSKRGGLFFKSCHFTSFYQHSREVSFDPLIRKLSEDMNKKYEGKKIPKHLSSGKLQGKLGKEFRQHLSTSKIFHTDGFVGCSFNYEKLKKSGEYKNTITDKFSSPSISSVSFVFLKSTGEITSIAIVQNVKSATNEKKQLILDKFEKKFAGYGLTPYTKRKGELYFSTKSSDEMYRCSVNLRQELRSDCGKSFYSIYYSSVDGVSTLINNSLEQMKVSFDEHFNGQNELVF